MITREKQSAGFTLIELLVALAIIALLSTLVFTFLTQARDRSQVTSVSRQLEEIQRAFTLWADNENIQTWWRDDSFGLGNNPTLNDLIANTGLVQFLPNPPVPPLGGAYHYRNSGTANTDCSGADADGVVIYLDTTSEYLNVELDELIDKGDGRTCGRFQYPANHARSTFLISTNESF
jgi:prepilin-type N-terminal cleavage/methylation domain-containing protein